MSGKVLVLGYQPPPLLAGTRIEAAHYRTWQFVEGLLPAAQRILLYAGARSEPPAEPEQLPAAWQDSVEFRPFTPEDASWRRTLQRAHDDFQPDCIVAVNFFHALYATTLQTERPIWMDIYGDMLTIQQAAMFRQGADRGLRTTIDFMRLVALGGDHYSVCATPQKHLLVGQLSMAGRLNARTFAHEFVDVVLPGAPPAVEPLPERRSAREALRLPSDAFAVLWCGGYNTWTDVDTLFAGLERAMKADAAIHFVSVGASTYGAADNQYERLLGLIASSPFRERYMMRGWRPWDEIPAYYAAADVGINIDALHYETLYGTRTRLLEMIAAGLPVVTSLGSEISLLLAERGAGLGFEPGDAATLGDRLVTLAASPGQHRDMAKTALRLARTDFSFEATTEPVRRWAASPQVAPDRLAGGSAPLGKAAEYRTRAILRGLLWRLRGEER